VNVRISTVGAGADVRPLGERILVTRLEGHGIETVSPGGIIIPATAEKSVRTKADYFRARVEVLGPDAEKAYAGDLKPGDEVLVYTYSGTADSVFTGDDAGQHRMFVRPDDILGQVVAS
jgi:co-chaperonin GroES (HSP10)